MKFLRTSTVLLLGLLILSAFLLVVFKEQPGQIVKSNDSYKTYNNKWLPPDEAILPFDSMGRLVRYGKELFVNTAVYLGPKGMVAQLTNGMNCQNCHIAAGTQLFANCLSAVAANYPRYRDRSGIVESIEIRINDCMMRSLNGHSLDSMSKEMRAMVAYLKWLGKDVPSAVRPWGAGYELSIPTFVQLQVSCFCTLCHKLVLQTLKSAPKEAATFCYCNFAPCKHSALRAR